MQATAQGRQHRAVDLDARSRTRGYPYVCFCPAWLVEFQRSVEDRPARNLNKTCNRSYLLSSVETGSARILVAGHFHGYSRRNCRNCRSRVRVLSLRVAIQEYEQSGIDRWD